MMGAFFGGLAFFLAALWEAHVFVFLPWWASLSPLWGIVVIGLCLEADLVRLAAGLCAALVWEELVRPMGVPPIAWIWLPLLFVSFWLLRVWLSHRSLLSVLVLTVFGRLVWILFRLWDVLGVSMERVPWKEEMMLWGALIAWDALFTVTAFLVVSALSKWLSPFMPRFSDRNRL